MESVEFDAALGGTEHLPHSANSLKFAASRSIEIAAMTESILRPSKTKLIFQTLPVHMRRRVMSHNCKRLPRRLREGHLEQLIKSGLPPKQKRPSRKHRRRPTNLLEEYNRRQKRNVWLETHIWHAKRFHMVERWGHRLPYRPCDKAFRACYRATSAHCLLQDISYYTPIKIQGSFEIIIELFKNITSRFCDLSIGAKAYLNGNREGSINLYMPDSYPFQFIGRVQYLWIHSDNVTKEIWLFVHPSQAKLVENVLNNLINKSASNILNYENKENSIVKKRKIMTKFSDIKLNVMVGAFNRFRLTGPRSHAVLVEALKCVENIEKIQCNDWVHEVLKSKNELFLKEKHEYWNSLKSLSSPSQVPSRLVIGLVIKDPRWSRPIKRTKAETNFDSIVKPESLIYIPAYSCVSPIWNTSIRDIIKNKKVTNSQFIQHITKTQLVPGEINENDPALQSIPILLIQRPGSQNSEYKKVGYGSGWDIISPSGYGLPLWLTLIMFGARSGGLRETESLAFEMGENYLPPDSEAGRQEENRLEIEMKEKYFKKPPSKRVNYIKLAVSNPFLCPWRILLKDWGKTKDDKMFVLRDRNILNMLEDCINKKAKLSEIENSDYCLVPIYLQVIGKGHLTKHAMICMPQIKDISSNQKLMEPHHEDPNEKLRRLKRREHNKVLKQMRKRRLKLRKSATGVLIKTKKNNGNVPSEYVKTMRELWLPTNTQSVRNVSIREIMGYLTHGAFSFSESKSCGTGYIAYNSLVKLLNLNLNKVLIRNTTSRIYRLANIRIIKSSSIWIIFYLQCSNHIRLKNVRT
ncbi:unnamed protein product, partial [Brenthis ino]